MGAEVACPNIQGIQCFMITQIADGAVMIVTDKGTTVSNKRSHPTIGETIQYNRTSERAIGNRRSGVHRSQKMIFTHGRFAGGGIRQLSEEISNSIKHPNQGLRQRCDDHQWKQNQKRKRKRKRQRKRAMHGIISIIVQNQNPRAMRERIYNAITRSYQINNAISPDR